MESKPRLLVLTDIGSDPDDEQSLVRLLVHSNEFDIEGIIPNLWVGHKGRHGPLSPEGQLEVVREAIRRYGQVEENLKKHAKGFPLADALLPLVKRGAVEVPFALDQADHPNWKQLVGPNRDTEGSDFLISVVDRDDPRPVNVTVWGGPADLAQALWRVRSDRSAEELSRFVSKIRVYSVEDQDDTGPWIREQFPDLFFILNRSRDGDKWNSCYRGMYSGGDESLTSRKWIDAHVRNGHGPLGAFYSEKTYTGSNPHGALKEGDTPSWLYFYNNGLHVPEKPGYGGWGGRFAPNGTFWQDATDQVNGETSQRACTWRWRPAYQNEFQARMDWCLASPADANHLPVAVVNSDKSQQPVPMEARPGETVHLDATGSSDLDGGNLAFRWWVYREAGGHGRDVRIAKATERSTSLRIPDESAGKTIHIILEATNSGNPPLTAYRRVVISVVWG